MTVKHFGLDLPKDVFQVHCVSATGRNIINKKIKRAKLIAFFETLPRCVVGMEACGSSHHWGRKLRAQARRTSAAIENQRHEAAFDASRS